MPQEEEELDVNELKGSNQITKETRMSPSNDQDIITTFGRIDKTSFDDGQKWDNECISAKGENTLQDMLEVGNFGVSSPPHPNMGIGNWSNVILSPMIHPFPLHLDIVLRDLRISRVIERAQNHYKKLVEVEADQHIVVPWEPPTLLPFKPQPRLFHLLLYMLKKFN